MVDFVGTLQAVSIGLKVLKDLNAVDRELDQATLKLKVAELSTALATAQITLAQAQSEARDKDAEISKLKDSFKNKNEILVEHEGLFYRKRSNGKPEGRAYCPKCMLDGTLIMTAQHQGLVNSKCPICNTVIRSMHFTFENE